MNVRNEIAGLLEARRLVTERVWVAAVSHLVELKRQQLEGRKVDASSAQAWFAELREIDDERASKTLDALGLDLPEPTTHALSASERAAEVEQQLKAIAEVRKAHESRGPARRRGGAKRGS